MSNAETWNNAARRQTSTHLENFSSSRYFWPTNKTTAAAHCLTILKEKCQQPRNFFLFWQLKSNLVQLEYYKEMWGKRPGFLATLSESESCSVMSESLWHHGLYSPWNSPGQNTGIGSCSLPQGIFPTQGLNPGLPRCRRVLYQLSYQGSPQWL